MVACRGRRRRPCNAEGPNRLIYISADGMRTQDLRRAFAIGRALTLAAASSQRLWLVDEITSVAGWEQLIKELRDNTAMTDDGVVLTRSSASGFEEAVRAVGAGRTRTAEPFRTLLPMTFADVLASSGFEAVLPAPVSPDQLQAESVRDIIERLSASVDDLDLAWRAYLDSGGFPQAVSETHRHGDISSVFAQDFQAWLSTDVAPGELSDSVSLLLEAIHRRSGSPLSVAATADALHLTRERMRGQPRSACCRLRGNLVPPSGRRWPACCGFPVEVVSD